MNKIMHNYFEFFPKELIFDIILNQCNDTKFLRSLNCLSKQFYEITISVDLWKKIMNKLGLKVIYETKDEATINFEINLLDIDLDNAAILSATNLIKISKNPLSDYFDNGNPEMSRTLFVDVMNFGSSLDILKDIPKIDIFNDEDYITWKEKYDQMQITEPEDEMDECTGQLEITYNELETVGDIKPILSYSFWYVRFVLGSEFDTQEYIKLILLDEEDIFKVFKILCIAGASVTDNNSNDISEDYFGNTATIVL